MKHSLKKTICPPSKLVCPPSKFNLPIAHPVKHLAHRKMGITIIKDRQFRPKFFFEVD